MSIAAESGIFPWFDRDWQKLTGNPDQFHHGLLLKGRPGIGKREFALQLCRYLMCTDAFESRPCGDCQNCRLLDAGTHPDFHVLTTEQESVDGRLALVSEYSNRYQDSRERDRRAKPTTVINIDQVRTLIERFAVHSHIAHTRVALILPADRLNINAGNALLKVLEEPPEDSLFILVSAESHRLPMTIRSRCTDYALSSPSPEDATRWLEQQDGSANWGQALALAGGGPLKALQLNTLGWVELYADLQQELAGILTRHQNPLDLAARLAKGEFEQVLQWIQNFTVEAV